LTGTWAGRWQNVVPDQASGTVEVILVQTGLDLTGAIDMKGSACFATGGLRGTVAGSKIVLRVVQRDEVEFDGVVSGGKMGGPFSIACDVSSGTWSLARVP
jgi:hypothetical protein